MLTLIFNLEWYRRSFWIDFDYIPNLDLYFYNEGTYVNSQKSNNGGLSEKKNKEGLPNSTKSKHWVMKSKTNQFIAVYKTNWTPRNVKTVA